MSAPKLATLLSLLEVECGAESDMKFRLTYEGELRPTQREPIDNQRNPLAEHKHQIRRKFHNQLKHLWATDRFLSRYRISPENPNIGKKRKAAADSMFAMWAPSEDEKEALVDVVAARHATLGYRFVPLVTVYFDLLCSLHILFLRHDVPGSAIQAGDIDNRIKTLIDSLRVPQYQEELVGEDACPREGEDPFFCLLQDDNQVSGFAVETDTLLDPPDGSGDDRKVKIVVTVELRPYYATPFNLSFV